MKTLISIISLIALTGCVPVHAIVKMAIKKEINKDFKIRCDRATGISYTPVETKVIPAFSQGACEKTHESSQIKYLLEVGAVQYSEMIRQFAHSYYQND